MKQPVEVQLEKDLLHVFLLVRVDLENTTWPFLGMHHRLYRLPHL